MLDLLCRRLTHRARRKETLLIGPDSSIFHGVSREECRQENPHQGASETAPLSVTCPWGFSPQGTPVSRPKAGQIVSLGSS